MSEKMLKVLYPTVPPVVGNHSVSDVQILGLRLVSQIHGLNEIVPTIVRMDVIVPGIPTLTRHINPAAHLHFNRGPLTGPYIKGSFYGFIFKSTPHLECGLTDRHIH